MPRLHTSLAVTSLFFLFLALGGRTMLMARFYYVDERKADGSAAFQIDGDAHAELFWGLALQKEHRPWLQTFVKGEGYRKFAVPA